MRNRNLLLGIIGILAITLVCVVGITLFILTSNNFPLAVPPTLDINTAVADISDSFTATPTKPTNTPTLTFTPTPYQTRTPLPSWTVSVTPSPAPTRTPFPSRTLTPSITPTRSTENPGSGLGDPTWIDTFKTADGWTLFDDECFKTDIRNGKYIQTTKRVPAGACWEVTWAKIQDFYMETVAHVPGSCAERDRYGIYFRGVDTQQGYLFGVTCKQEYWLSFWNSETSQRETLIDYTVSDKIHTGAGHTNKLGIQTSGDRIILYINDVLVAEVHDSTYTQKGLIGFFIGAQVTPAFTVEYDYWAYWENP
jgi:hypothetical protein